jgi:hypothetical protein
MSALCQNLSGERRAGADSSIPLDTRGTSLVTGQIAIHFFLELAVILAACRLVGLVARRFGQPQVVGEMITGVILGPSLLGLVAPGVQQYLFPSGQANTVLYTMAQIGLVLYMFLIGLNFDVDLISKMGLRMFFSHDGNTDLARRPELGGSTFVPQTTYQIDRGRLENELHRRCLADGIEFVTGRVRSSTWAPETVRTPCPSKPVTPSPARRPAGWSTPRAATGPCPANWI